MAMDDGTRSIGHWLSAHRWQILLLFLGVLVPLVIFGDLAEEIFRRQRIAWDVPILLAIHAHASHALDGVMLFFTYIGYKYGVVPVDVGLVLFWLVRRRWGDFFFFGLATGGAAALDELGKHFFGRVRPALWPSPAPEKTFSFPSGHAMGSMALVAALVVMLWPTRWRWPAIGLGVLFVGMVGLSRLYLGVHYPSDILAGWAASLAWVVGLSEVLYGRAAKPAPDAAPSDAPGQPAVRQRQA